MPQAQDASSYVYQGLWTNWSKGHTYGATLTLSPPNATILVSVIAIFVQVAGSQLWKISQFAIHQYRATPKPKDGLYHQGQVILRNSTSDFNTLWHLLRVAVAWRHQKAAKSMRRFWPLMSWALSHSVFFALAGVFSSTLLAAGDEVLSRSPFCGTYNQTYIDSMGNMLTTGMPNHLATEFRAKQQERYQSSQEYVQFCSGPSTICNSLPKRQLYWNSTSQASCPFEQAVCSDIDKSIIFDTGFLSSHLDFGLNAPKADLLTYRKVTTCTTLNDARFISDWKTIPASAVTPAKRVVDAYYGPNPLADRGATYSYSEWDKLYSFDQYSDTNPYQINVQIAFAADTEGEFSDFIPISQLARSDADVTLVFLSFTKAYESAVDDPWFFAQSPEAYPVRNNSKAINGTIYTREKPVTTLGCTEQHQVCVGPDSSRSGQNKCTPMMGAYQIITEPNGVNSLNITPRQETTFERVFQSAVDSTFFQVLHGLAQRDPPLLARRRIQGFVGLGLPSNQWQLETEYWHSIAMANLQRAVVEYGTGQFAASTDYINLTATPEQRWLCHNLLIRGTVYQSYNFFGLMLVFTIGVLIVIFGLTIEDAVALWRKKKGCSSFRRDMWRRNEMLEMLCMLFKRDGQGTWSHSLNGIPISGPGQMIWISEPQKQEDVGTSLTTFTQSAGILPAPNNSLDTVARLAGPSAAEVSFVGYDGPDELPDHDRVSNYPVGQGVVPSLISDTRGPPRLDVVYIRPDAFNREWVWE